eukprot:CAMPEP_0204821956 /NCGR_PEP_ID=MMETSP1346-20131115/150_1 /ASSEMBLY_ACC=CAM_ASM_000771 /TAXON_ID=215587 /ORGANISM="Aplanochytrium stocchinoi, Strain GSBS06" /LENGTH=628 /DNA_ID=CAMNT_0051947935 /DNA_START=74 /DNA_END=1960 /DNA_ORIENTATION=+
MAGKLREALAQTLLTFVLYKKLNVQANPLYKLAGVILLIQYLLSNKMVKQVLQLFSLKFNETPLDRVACLALKAPAVKKEYAKELEGVLQGTRDSTKKAWEQFGELITKIPEDGYTFSSLTSLVDKLAAATEKTVGTDEWYSGSIYSYSYMKGKYGNKKYFEKLESEKLFLENPDDYAKLTISLGELYTYSFQRSYLWNSLHEAEFGAGYWLSYQVVRMVADLYGGEPDKVMGLITSGGTESLMTAMRLYRNWGMVNRNHDIGQGVVLVCESIHAAVNKACIAYDLKIEIVPVDKLGKCDIPALKKAVKRIGNDLITIVGSTPSYTLGVVDPIKEIASIAYEAGVGMHVDSCLGGFIVNFLDHIDSDFLKLPGVTSISCDTHKNGWAPKGSSVVLTNDIRDILHEPKVNLMFYSAYAVPSWDGGIYGTPQNPGSQHATHMLHAYLAMLRIGKNGYRKIAKNIHRVVKRCSEIIENDPRCELLGDSPANVFAWRINPKLGWEKGAIYALAHEMSQRNIVLSAMKGDRVHYCVTGRSSADDSFVHKFEASLKESLDVTEGYAKDVAAGKCAFPGDAGLYGTMEAAMQPSSENTKSAVEYYSNLILGHRVACDAIKSHFYGLLDPFRTDSL